MNPTLWISLVFMLTWSMRMIILNLLRSSYLRDFFGCYWIPKAHSKGQSSETKITCVWALMNAWRPLGSLSYPCGKVFDSHFTDENRSPRKVSITCMILISEQNWANIQLLTPQPMPYASSQGGRVLCIVLH